MHQTQLLKLITFLVLLSGCTEKSTVTPAFYVWKTKLGENDADISYLKKIKAEKFYIRMFDVDDKGNGAFPIAGFSADSSHLPGEVIPVIFLTNRTFLKCKTNTAETLAEKCVKKIDEMCMSHFGKLPQAYQFDCDWTEKTREAYFSFLQTASKLRPTATVSCTIRLHQIKYKDNTGVPPVSKGTLMYYASSEPTRFESPNTILDNVEASLYINDIHTYPLHLDIAFPLYSWGIVRNQFNKIKLINKVCVADVAAHPHYYKEKQNGIYEVLQSHYLKGMWVNKGYELKIEEVSPQTLQEAARILRKKLKKEDREIIFYHLDEDILKRYSPETLQNIIQTFT